MTITIENKVAAIKQGSSFEYVVENREFSGQDAYTLEICFPLKGCPQNQAIFGNIFRQDIIPDKLIYECELRDGSFCKYGSLTLTSVTESVVTGQFLEGRAEINFSEILEETFIDELSLGYAEGGGSPATRSPRTAWNYQGRQDFIILPWVNNASGFPNNFAHWDGTQLVWDDNTTDMHAFSFMPTMLYLTRKIFEAAGLACDLSAWEESETWNKLICCNVEPASWYPDNFANVLPHWSLSEYMEQLELLLDGEFEMNYREACVTFRFREQVLTQARQQPVLITDVLDEHAMEVRAEDSSCNYLPSKNLAFSLSDFDVWPIYSCPKFIEAYKDRAVVCDTMEQMREHFRNVVSSSRQPRFSNGDFVYCKESQTYYTTRNIRKVLVKEREDYPNDYTYINEITSLNSFGPWLPNGDPEDDTIELKIVPVFMDDTDEEHGRCMFLPIASDESGKTASGHTSMKNLDFAAIKAQQDAAFQQPQTFRMVMWEKTDDSSHYLYNQIYVAFWDGTFPQEHIQPYPIVEPYTLAQNRAITRSPYSLRINNRSLPKSLSPEIDSRQKRSFKFLANEIPDPRAIFYIRGKRYLCEKLTATFSERGMSRLISGDFWPIKDCDNWSDR